jgi:uncharacterized protein with von Willebrand factor type A (vWA) domain
VDHFNDEPGVTWLQRMRETFPHSVWLNPEPQGEWGYTESIKVVNQLFDGRMYPLTLDGLTDAMNLLRRRSSRHVPRLN